MECNAESGVLCDSRTIIHNTELCSHNSSYPVTLDIGLHRNNCSRNAYSCVELIIRELQRSGVCEAEGVD